MNIVFAHKNTAKLHTSRSTKKFTKKSAKKTPRSPARLPSPRSENEEIKGLGGKSPMADNGKSPNAKS